MFEDVVLEESRENTVKKGIDKEEHDKKCAKYSTAGFLCGVAGVMVLLICDVI